MPVDDATLDAWATSDDPVRRAHAANLRALRAGRPAERAMPPLRERARNLAGAAFTAIRSGVERAAPEEQARRLAICGGCEFLRGGRCLKCGCVTDWKTRLAAWHCPVDKW